jgi:hypothetical protein
VKLFEICLFDGFTNISNEPDNRFKY